jgi:hypothetical protein
MGYGVPLRDTVPEILPAQAEAIPSVDSGLGEVDLEDPHT